MKARVVMSSVHDGGLTEPMPSPCRSLLLRLDGPDEDVGVSIVTQSGLALTAEGSYEVEMTIWAGPVFLDYIRPGSRFTLRYPVQVVGTGEVVALKT